MFYGKNLKKEDFTCQTNGLVSNSILQNWTPSAVDCYKINCNCANCPITKANYSFKCQMKHIVDTLLKTVGKPDEKLVLEENENNVA